MSYTILRVFNTEFHISVAGILESTKQYEFFLGNGPKQYVLDVATPPFYLATDDIMLNKVFFQQT